MPISVLSRRLACAWFHNRAVALLALFLSLATVSAAHAATATATWNTNPESNIAGYKLSYGTVSHSYTSTVDVGNVTSYALQVVAGQTYYFAVQAYNTSGMLSAYSTEVPFTVAVSSAPSITSLSPTGGSVGTSVTIAGANFGSSKGSSTVTFNGSTATPSSWSAASIVVPVPGGATTGNVIVTVGGVASNARTFTVTATAPSITSLSPTSGAVGTSVTIAGANFGSSKGTSTVTFNGTTATPSSWSASSIVVPVPSGTTTGNVSVTVGGIASNGRTFTVTSTQPTVTSLSPTSGAAGTVVTIAGANFGATKGSSTVTFNGKSATPTSWSASGIVVPVPSGATTGNVVVTVGGVASNGVVFTIGTATAPALVQHRGLETGGASDALAFTSANTAGNFIAVAIRSYFVDQVYTVSDSRGNVYRQALKFNNGTDDTVAIFYAENVAAGTNTVTVSQSKAASLRFAILEYSGVATSGSLDVTSTAAQTSSSPNSGSAVTTGNGDLVIGAFATQSYNTFTAGSGYTIREAVLAAPSTALMIEDKVQAAAGSVSSTATLSSSDMWGAAVAAFKPQSAAATPSATLTSLSPTSGPVGTSVTIAGSNFGATKGTSTVTFNGTTATPTTWSASSIVVSVPSGATTGNVVVNVGGIASNGVPFTVAQPTSSAISLVQHSNRDAGVTTSSSLAFSAANIAGHWIGVVIRGGGSGQVFTVTDTLGNTYRKAVQFTHTADSVSMAIFYAENIRGGANTVKISDTISGTMRFAILEYAGVATTNSLDVTKTGQGSGKAASSGSVSTTSSGELLLGGLTTGNGSTSTAGSGFVKRDSVPSSSAKLMVEDLIQSSAGAVAATASMSASDSWAMVLAAFKPAAGGGTTSTQSLTAQNSTLDAAVSPDASVNAEKATGALTKNDGLRATDYDGDLASDLATFTASTGDWAILLSGDNYTRSLTVALGSKTDVPVPGDYDGDGRTDIAVYRPSSGSWRMLQSSSGYKKSVAYAWGSAGDIPMPADYDGDGTTDLAVYRPATGEWLITLSATKATVTLMLGAIGDLPIVGDFDGDRRADIGVFTPSSGAWTILTSSSNYTTGPTLSLGSSGDVPVVADYDGDGIADAAVYQTASGRWSIATSASSYASVTTATLGGDADIPVPGDYDGDGRADVAVYRPATGSWTIVKSSDGSTMTFAWGTSASIPAPRRR